MSTATVTPPSEHLRRNIAELRKRYGWSQRELASWLGDELGRELNRSAYAKMELGSRQVTVDEAFALASVFRVSVDTLAAPISIGVLVEKDR